MSVRTLDVPVVDAPPAGARLGDVVYREDFEEYAVNTVLGWVPCRPARVPVAVAAPAGADPPGEAAPAHDRSPSG